MHPEGDTVSDYFSDFYYHSYQLEVLQILLKTMLTVFLLNLEIRNNFTKQSYF